MNESSAERKRKNAFIRENNESRLRALFQKFPIHKAQYDEECMDLCIPYADVITNAKYKELVADEFKVNQLASILMRYKKIDHSLLKDLCFVIKRIDAYDFSRFRDDKADLRQLRNKVLNIPDDYIVSLKDIDARVEEESKKMKVTPLPFQFKSDIQAVPNSKEKTPIWKSNQNEKSISKHDKYYEYMEEFKILAEQADRKAKKLQKKQQSNNSLKSASGRKMPSNRSQIERVKSAHPSNRPVTSILVPFIDLNKVPQARDLFYQQMEELNQLEDYEN